MRMDTNKKYILNEYLTQTIERNFKQVGNPHDRITTLTRHMESSFAKINGHDYWGLRDNVGVAIDHFTVVAQ